MQPTAQKLMGVLAALGSSHHPGQDWVLPLVIRQNWVLPLIILPLSFRKTKGTLCSQIWMRLWLVVLIDTMSSEDQERYVRRLELAGCNTILRDIVFVASFVVVAVLEAEREGKGWYLAWKLTPAEGTVTRIAIIVIT